ncbi:MAG: substrate-binding domain-containing protein [Bacilli bacterium]|nr:substrate-binding domain-containing protein [Bacilli bacterium]
MKKIMKSLLAVICLFGLVVGLTGCKTTDDALIKAYTRDTTSGTRDGFFTNIDFEAAKADNSGLVTGYVEVDSNGSMINAIKNDEYGIGYISLASLSESGLKGLVYEGVTPNETNVLNGTYKLTRNFNYIVRSDYSTTKEEEIVEAYLAFLTTKDAKATIQSKDGIIEINSSDPTWDSIKNDYPICQEDNSMVTIKFGGSTSVEKIAKALSSEFSSKCGNFKIEHNHTGSGDAYKRTQGSEKDGANFLHIAFLSRELKDTEAAATGTSGKICVDAIVAVVNSKNELATINAEILKKIYDGSITKWSEVE